MRPIYEKLGYAMIGFWLMSFGLAFCLALMPGGQGSDGGNSRGAKVAIVDDTGKRVAARSTLVSKKIVKISSKSPKQHHRHMAQK